MQEFYDVYTSDYKYIARRKQREVMTKFEALGHNEGFMYDFTSDVIRDSDKFTSSYAQGVQSKLSFTVYNKDNKYTINDESIFWYGNKIKYYKGLRDPVTKNIYWFTMGVFIVCDVSAKETEISVDCVDKFGLFTSDCGYGRYDAITKIEAGTAIGQLITDLLLTDMGNGKVLDSTPPIIDDSVKNDELIQDFEGSCDGYIGEFLTEIATTMKCRIYYNNTGHLYMCRGISENEYAYKAPTWEFDKDKSAEYLEASAKYDFANVINRITVWGEDANGEIYTYTAENRNPKSPTRISRIGIKSGKTIENLLGYDQKNVESFAKYYLRIKTVQGISVPLDCMLLPHIKVEDVVYITDTNYGFNQMKMLVNEINIQGNTMSLGLVNIDSLPFYEELQD